MPTAATLMLALGGWLVPWQHDSGLESVSRAKGALEDVFLFAARLDGEGMPVLDQRGPAWQQTAEKVRNSGARVWLTVVNDRVSGPGPAVLKDAELVHR